MSTESRPRPSASLSTRIELFNETGSLSAWLVLVWGRCVVVTPDPHMCLPARSASADIECRTGRLVAPHRGKDHRWAVHALDRSLWVKTCCDYLRVLVGRLSSTAASATPGVSNAHRMAVGVERAGFAASHCSTLFRIRVGSAHRSPIDTVSPVSQSQAFTESRA